MKQQQNLFLLIALAGAVLLTMTAPSHAQRITPEPASPAPDQTNQRSDTSGKQRLILPENVEADTPADQKRSMYNRARVEELLADSAAMRVQFEETISRLKTDSAAMRKRYEKKISRLKKKIRSLKKQVKRIKAADTQSDRDGTRADTSTKRPDLELPGTAGKRMDTGHQDTGSAGQSTSGDGEEEVPEGSVFNPNTASLSDLKSIPGLSERLAERIEWYRREVRPFDSRKDLRRVPGIDRKIYQKISSYFHEGPY